ncbi:MAG TPA: hypothetical protein VIL74_11990 [Pyrinomonadaceae bacterium]|jgi:hypothetical protein
MTENVDFDALARKTAESNGAIDDLNELWSAAFALPEWHFIARGELPNISPYIASNANYANGAQMARAFTDTDRALRFAKENNLTKADASAPLLSLPTAKAVDYLEQFIQFGVHGIWFNSDSGSDGFFLPLKQLRPVKEHLAKMNRQPPAAAVNPVANPATVAPPAQPTAPPVEPAAPEAQPPELDAAESARATLVVTVQDGLALPSGFVSRASYACNFFCRVPADWVADGALRSEYLERIYERVYGQNWRSGNSDGSRYVIIDEYARVLSPEEIDATKWSATRNTEDNHFWFYIVDANGIIQSVKPEEFQADIENQPPQAEPKTVRAAEPRPEQRLEDHKIATSLGGESDLNLAYFRRGEVAFDATIAPLQEKLNALLENYRGSGEFGDILLLADDAPEGLVENVERNANGAYLRNRRFFYQPDGGAIVAATTLDSNELRQPQTNSTLRVSFALLKNLVSQTAQLYFRFEGPKNEVLDLANAVKPVLETYRFREIPVD